MSRLKTDAIRNVNASVDGITLDTSGNVAIPNELQLADKIVHTGDTNTLIRFPAADVIAFETGGTERLRINSDGRIWVNTQTGSSATELLRVENTGSSSTNSRVSIVSGGAAQAVLLFGDDQSFDQGQIVYSNSDHSMRFHANAGNERLRITSNGRLLLNTADNSGYSNRSAYFTNPNDNWNYISITGSGGAGIVFGDSTGQNVGNYESYMYHDNSDNHFYIRTDQGNQRFTFDNNGHLGLGPNNTAPSGAIHINDSGQQSIIVGSTNAGGAYLILDGDSNGDSSGSDYSYIGHTTAGDLEIAADNPAGNGNIFLKSNSASYQAVGCYASGPVELRYQNGTRFQTTSTGAILTSGAAGTTSCRFGNTANRGLEVNVVNNGNNDAGVVLNAADSENSGYAAYIAFQTGGEEKGRFEGQYDNFRLSNTCSGITFNGDYAAANRLNDYEEGTWTPAVTSGLSAGQISYNSRSGKYTKVGNLVTFTFHMNISSASLDSGALKFGGLPFTAVNTSHTAGGAWKIFTNGNIDANATYKVIGNATDVQVITAAGDAMAANATSINAGNRHMAYWGFYYV